MAIVARLFKNKWITPPKDTNEDYSRRTIIITGATSGLGKEAAYQFAALGATKVILAARNLEKGESTKVALEARLGRKDQLEVWELDMMSYDSVVAFAKRATELDHLDIAIMNAGVRKIRYAQSQYGWEEDLQIHTLSTTLLAILLIPKLKESKRYTGKTPVLEFVNTGFHETAIVPPEVRQESNVLQHYNQQENFDGGELYRFSKVFLMYATKKLADEISSEDVLITSICPGAVKTDLGRDFAAFPGYSVLTAVPFFLLFRTPVQGAKVLLSGTTQGESAHGRFWQFDVIRPVPPSLTGTAMQELGARIWDEIIEALEKDVPGVDEALDAALRRR